jgi:hypothetical protein
MLFSYVHDSKGINYCSYVLWYVLWSANALDTRFWAWVCVWDLNIN